VAVETASRLVVVSNRLPAGDPPPGTERRAAPVGGLVSGLQPALESHRGARWIGWSGRPCPAKPGLTRATLGSTSLVGLDLPDDEVEAHYDGYCNGALWPLLHGFQTRAVIDAGHRAAHLRVNERFAKLVLKHLDAGTTTWVHDYHLFPLGQLLRAGGARGPLGFFLHVPFPPHDVLSVLPWARQLLEELEAYDLVGFHTRAFAQNYAECVRRELGRAPRARHGAFPIGIDPEPYARWSAEEASKTVGEGLRSATGNRKLLLGVDRLDYTKGIVERLRAFERLLETHEEWRGKVSFVQISSPSRTRVQEYVLQRNEIEGLVGRINGRFGETDWVPVRYLFRSYTQRQLAALYREADVCVVTPVRDGMNLVAKEFVASQTGDPGVLLLSRFAGAAEELTEAVIVNPYDTDGTAAAYDRALTMPLPERTLRHAALLRKVRRGSAARWSSLFLTDLTAAAAEAA
jgi:alpha,alpha-trehalose-phosphate synthase [UDP-forming]